MRLGQVIGDATILKDTVRRMEQRDALKRQQAIENRRRSMGLTVKYRRDG